MFKLIKINYVLNIISLKYLNMFLYISIQKHINKKCLKIVDREELR
jgi:hypothetical protein